MRLICPNCAAQYEVTADVIPAAGRDVQCSNCGHTWFETPGASEAAEAAAQADAADIPPEDGPVNPPKAAPEPTSPPQMAPPPPPASVPNPNLDLSPAPQRPAPPNPDAPAPPRPPLDNAIADMLREEAAREEAMRAAEADTGIEGQPDLGLDTMPTMTPEKRAEGNARVDALTGQAANAAAIGSRRELLPNIDEINSTLRSDAERADGTEDSAEATAQKRGFRFGFTMVMTFFIVLVALYLFADQISAAAPSLEGTMAGYVDTVDTMRLWLDAQVEKVLAMVEQSGDDSAGS